MGKWNDKCLDDYFDLMHERPNAFTQSPILSIVTDKQRMLTFMESTNKQLGVVYKSPFHLMVVDLIAGVNGEDFAYERLLPTVEKGAVVCLVEYNNKIVLERVSGMLYVKSNLSYHEDSENQIFLTQIM